MEKILFLDFDGVLHSTTSSSEKMFSQAEPLAEVLVKNPCSIVISSSWRFHYSLDEIKERLPSSMRDLIQGATGEPYIGKWPRYNEIKEFLIKNRLYVDWRALDDSFLEFPTHCQELILCQGKNGFTVKEQEILESWLES